MSLMVPWNASGSPGYRIERPSSTATLKLQGTNGYHLGIHAFSPGFVILEASKGALNATYSVHARVTPHSIEASFGKLGRVSVHFQGSPKATQQSEPGSKRCTGKQPVEEEGAFRGVIRFRGEGDFTKADATGAKGTLSRTFRQVCKRHAPKHRAGHRGEADSGPQMTTLLAASRSEGRRTWLWVISDGQQSLLWANVSEQREGVWISHTALPSGHLGTLRVSDGAAGQTARITAPTPFTGTATYTLDLDGSPLWTGPLAVSLPGIGATALAGPEFSAAFCPRMTTEQLQACLEPVLRKLGADSESATGASFLPIVGISAP